MGKIECDLIQVEKFSLGTIHRSNFELARMSKNGAARSQIGMDLLKDSCLHFHFDKSHVEVLSEEQNIPARNHTQLTLDKKNIPFVDLKVNGNLASCFWDSGAGITCVDFSFIKKNPDAFEGLGSLGIEDTAESGNVDMPLYLMRGLSHDGNSDSRIRVNSLGNRNELHTLGFEFS
jgi:hypothetical protein